MRSIFASGTQHVIYALLPVIAEVARKAGIRPERPLSISVIAAQQGLDRVAHLGGDGGARRRARRLRRRAARRSCWSRSPRRSSACSRGRSPSPSAGPSWPTTPSTGAPRGRARWGSRAERPDLAGAERRRAVGRLRGSSSPPSSSSCCSGSSPACGPIYEKTGEGRHGDGPGRDGPRDHDRHARRGRRAPAARRGPTPRRRSAAAS